MPILPLKLFVQGQTPHDLIRALKTEFVSTGNPQEDGANIPDAFNWGALTRVAAKYFKHAPGVSCMLGPMNAAPKVPLPKPYCWKPAALEQTFTAE